MARTTQSQELVKTFCALCVSRCGAVARLEDGRFVGLDPDPTHPTGSALCIKGKLAPEIVYAPDRLEHPQKRTRPKGDGDPGWERISWDEALDTIAQRLKTIAAHDGPEAVVFASASPSTSAMSDAVDWLQRLRRAYGSPNFVASMELCGWGRYLATLYTFGASVPGTYMPDLERAGCILFWGYNPTVSRIAHATATVKACKRGAKLVVVDPRRAGLAARADHWLRPRPGTDGALALGLCRVMLANGWYDEAFVREWTNAPMLVRDDDGALLTERDVRADGRADRLVVWDVSAAAPAIYDPARGTHCVPLDALALRGSFEVPCATNTVRCRPVFEHVVALCERYDARAVADICGIEGERVEAAARTLWQARPLAYYAWSGVEQQTGSTQIARAIGMLAALSGCFDAPGGNVQFASVPTNPVAGAELMPPDKRARAIGLEQRPLGGARFEFVTVADFYTAALEHRPYRARGLVSFGANLLLAHADSRRGRAALEALDFHVHVDLFMSPTAEQADIVLPATSPFESEALRVGFEVSPDAQAWVQLRHPVVATRGEARSDTQIVFDLANRLGFGEHFWNGDIEAAYRYQLAPSGLTLEQLRAEPGGVRVPVETQHRKFAVLRDGSAVGFGTPSRKLEFYSQTLFRHGYPALPNHEEPLVSQRSCPQLAQRFPLVLTCAKSTYYCETQHRNLPGLRRRAFDPEVELHPIAAAVRGIAEGDWVRIVTPEGRVRARARLDSNLAPDVVCGQHGFWQACPEIDAPGYDPFRDDGANLNMIVRAAAVDEVGGSVPHRAYVCEVERLS